MVMIFFSSIGIAICVFLFSWVAGDLISGDFYLKKYLFWAKKTKAKHEIKNFFANPFNYSKKANLEIDSTIIQYQAELKERYSEDIALKNTLTEFAKQNCLDHALISIWDEIKYYPELAQRVDFEKFNILKIKDIEVINGKSARHNERLGVSFKWENIIFCIKNEIKPSFMPDLDGYSEFTIFESGELVFKVSACIRSNEYGSTLHSYSVEALKRKGAWGNFVVDSWKAIQIKKKMHSAEMGYWKADEIKSNFQW